LVLRVSGGSGKQYDSSDAFMSALLISIIAVLVQFGILRGKGDIMLPDNRFSPLDVAEARKSLLSETVFISDQTPNEEMVAQFIGEHGSDSLSGCCARGQNDFSGNWLFGWERIIMGPHSKSAVPTDISGRQISDVPKDHSSVQSVTPIPMSRETSRLDVDISALKNFGISGLAFSNSSGERKLTFTGAIQANGGATQPQSADCQNAGKNRKPKGIAGQRFFWLFPFFDGVIVAFVIFGGRGGLLHCRLRIILGRPNDASAKGEAQQRRE
jgi:hypothetical protein